MASADLKRRIKHEIILRAQRNMSDSMEIMEESKREPETGGFDILIKGRSTELLRTSEGFGAWTLHGWRSTFCFDFAFGDQYDRPVEVRL